MGWESSGVVGFNLGPLLEIWDGIPTYTKSWAGNLLVWLDLTLGLSLKVKRG